MGLKIIQEKENPLYKRKEVIAEIMTIIPPSIKEVENLFSEKFSKPAKNIKINGIKGKFGTQIFKIEANIYAAIPANVKLANIYIALTNVLHRFLHEDLAHRSKMK